MKTVRQVVCIVIIGTTAHEPRTKIQEGAFMITALAVRQDLNRSIKDENRSSLPQ